VIIFLIAATFVDNTRMTTAKSIFIFITVGRQFNL
jgi:hypothetical protein